MSDAILYWNDIALEANRVSHTNGKDEQTGPTLSSRALAIVHLAMYDAFIGADTASGPSTTDTHYLAPADLPVAKSGASRGTAIAAAAYTTLSYLFPSQQAFFDLVYDEDYAPVGVTATRAKDGYDYGKGVAAVLLTKRGGDPDKSDAGYKPKNLPGKHRRDPDNPTQGFHAPFYGERSKLFATKVRWTLAKPPKVETANGEYLRALRQVREKGIATELLGTLPASSTPRTPDETVIGIYWAYDGPPQLGTPPRLYNQIIRKLATEVPNPQFGNKVNELAQNARLFALVNTAMADAGILSWEQKYIHDLWRPVLGIREHGDSLGPENLPGNVIGPDADPWWLPLGAPLTNTLMKNFTPPFPAYPSGHATFGAAAFHIARRYYGVAANNTNPDTLFKKGPQNLTFVSDELNGVNKDNKGAVRPQHTREFPDGLWGMIVENGRSRVFLGVHWVFDAFAVTAQDALQLNQKVDLPNGIAGVGGVPLGLAIANDISVNGLLAANGADPLPQPAMAAVDVAAALEPVSPLDAAAPNRPWPLG